MPVKDKKIYFHVLTDQGGIALHSRLKDSPERRYLVRFAGAPKFLLQEFVEKYGDEDGVQRYEELIELFVKVGKRGFSPIVMYSYPPRPHDKNPDSQRVPE